jgi:hypothetical protein
MPTASGIRTITEKSLLAYFQANALQLPNVALHTGQSDQIRSLPIIIFHCESATAHRDLGANSLGNFELVLKVYIYSSADDNTLDDHRARVETVQALMQDVTGLQDAWVEGKLYAGWIVSDDEGMADRRYGNVLHYTLVAVYPE